MEWNGDTSSGDRTYKFVTPFAGSGLMADLLELILDGTRLTFPTGRPELTN